MAGFVRLMMTEGTRNALLRKRVYEAGPAIVALKLQAFLSEANERGILSISNTQLYAEQLIGRLREPLYQALMLNPAARQEAAAIDSVKAIIEGFVHGSASARRIAP